MTTSPLAGPFTRTIKLAPRLPVNAACPLQAPISFSLPPGTRGTFTTYCTFTWSGIAGPHSLPVKITGKGA